MNRNHRAEEPLRQAPGTPHVEVHGNGDTQMATKTDKGTHQIGA